MGMDDALFGRVFPWLQKRSVYGEKLPRLQMLARNFPLAGVSEFAHTGPQRGEIDGLLPKSPSINSLTQGTMQVLIDYARDAIYARMQDLMLASFIETMYSLLEIMHPYPGANYGGRVFLRAIVKDSVKGNIPTDAMFYFLHLISAPFTSVATEGGMRCVDPECLSCGWKTFYYISRRKGDPSSIDDINVTSEFRIAHHFEHGIGWKTDRVHFASGHQLLIPGQPIIFLPRDLYSM
ncbi:MAG: hypothetical protein WCW14_03775 [Candidatus Paceibacterota bacterium]|jgi:hypothetical protein